MTTTKTKTQRTLKPIRLYHHQTDGGARYLFDTYLKCQGGHREGTITDKTRFMVRIDGDIEKDCELTIADRAAYFAPELLAALKLAASALKDHLQYDDGSSLEREGYDAATAAIAKATEEE
jgi:hypothetical protein